MEKLKSDRVGIVGSREFKALEDVVNFVKGLPIGTTIVSGGAEGVDATAEHAAKLLGLDIDIKLPKRWSRTALLARNQDIVDSCDYLVAFWDGWSKGTVDTIRKAYRVDKQVFVCIHPWTEEAEQRMKNTRLSGHNWFERAKAKLRRQDGN